METTEYPCGCSISHSMFGDRELLYANLCQECLLKYGFSGGSQQDLANHIKNIHKISPGV